VSAPGQPTWTIRPAHDHDIGALEILIPFSAKTLQSAHYSSAQIAAALGPVFGVDRQLIRDGTYYVACAGDTIAGCGGWSRRRSLFGGDAARAGDDAPLEPAREAARVRAFFVHPEWTRRGIGRALLATSEAAIRSAGFSRIELVATLTGEPLYAAAGYSVVERYDVDLGSNLTLPVVRMTRQLGRVARS
jgi:GNAT superfamily N-acetyltransferase